MTIPQGQPDPILPGQPHFVLQLLAETIDQFLESKKKTSIATKAVVNILKTAALAKFQDDGKTVDEFIAGLGKPITYTQEEQEALEFNKAIMEEESEKMQALLEMLEQNYQAINALEDDFP